MALLGAAAVSGVLALVLVGLPLLMMVALGGIPLAWVERHRLRLIDRDPAVRSASGADRAGTVGLAVHPAA